MKLYSIIILFILSISADISAQNLVPNPSFEEYKKPLIYLGGIKPAKQWFCPNNGTPDVFNPKSRSFFNNNGNRYGIQLPQDGVVYSKILYENSGGYEYLSIELSSELEKYHIYIISFYLALADKSKFVMSGVDVDLSRDMPKVTKKDHDWNSDLRLFKYQYYPGENVVFLDTLVNNFEGWVKCHCIYKANGGEQFLIIGYFLPEKDAILNNVYESLICLINK